MKHGDKAKKPAKAQAAGKKASRKVASPSKTESKGRSSKAGSKAAAAPKTSSAKPTGGNGKGAARGVPGVVSFSNPVVAAAFKRALKKYPSAFRRLTD